MSKDKRQERKTREDTRSVQDEVKQIMKHKFLDYPWLTYEEQQKWCQLIDDALLSKGDWKKFIYHLPNPKSFNNIRKVNFGNLRSILKKMVSQEIATHKGVESFFITYLDTRIKIDLRDFWRALYYDFEDVCSIALNEALHMSAESPKKAKRTSYTWKAQEE